MRIDTKDRPKVKLSSLQLLASLGLNPAQVQLVSGFIDTYLKLNTQEKAIFEEQIVKIEPKEQEAVMQIVTSWMEEGIQQEAISLVLRLLNRPLQLQERIQRLSAKDLGEALLDFTSVSDLEAWFSK